MNILLLYRIAFCKKKYGYDVPYRGPFGGFLVMGYLAKKLMWHGMFVVKINGMLEIGCHKSLNWCPGAYFKFRIRWGVLMWGRHLIKGAGGGG